MMSLFIWAENVSESLETFSDLDFQIRVWIHGDGPEVSSLDEATCVLFDDSDFEGFLKLPEVLFNQKLFSALNEVYLALDAVTDDVMSDKKMNEAFLKSALWERIILLAKKAKMELDKARKHWVDNKR
jgi:hypothetical protein